MHLRNLRLISGIKHIWLRGIWSEAEIQQAEAELKNYNISFERNDVPNYLQGKNAYRIFVFGKDYLKLEEFTKRYYRSRI